MWKFVFFYIYAWISNEMDFFILRDSPFSYFNVGFLQMYEDWEFVLHFGH
jgi:hypothetical protein